MKKEEDVLNMVKVAAEKFGRIDIMGCNAGIYRASACVTDMDTSMLDDCLNFRIRRVELDERVAGCK